MKDGNNISHRSAIRYPSKRDLWIVILLIGAAALFLYSAVELIFYPAPVHPALRVFAILFFLGMCAILPWILFGTCYILTEEHLIIRCLSRQYPILLRDIYEVYPTHNPLSAPACSLDRLRVKFHGSKFGALISPRDKAFFMQDLLSRCPQLIQENDRLISKSDSS